MALALLPALFAPQPASATDMSGLIAHRAVYDVKLIEATDRSGIGSMTGRIVYEMEGNACDGFSVRYRFVTRINARGDIYTADQQMASWESGDGNVYQFLRRSLVNDQLDEETRGVAERAGGELSVSLTKPSEREFALDDAVFISAHLAEILERAEQGERFFRRDVYDGADGADSINITSNVIGSPGVFKEKLEGEEAEALVPLAGQSAWPVTIGYFDAPEPGQAETLPVYEVAFLLYEGGITRKLEMRYPDYSLSGALVQLEVFTDTSGCKSD